MAGNYPDAPGHRMAWDADGSVAMWRLTWITTQTDMPLADRQQLQGEYDGDHLPWPNGVGNNFYVTTIFPELREVDGVFFAKFGNIALLACYTSVDTTNGVDGAWVLAISNVAEYSSTPLYYRTGITDLALSNIKAIRQNVNPQTNSSVSLSTQHIYGTFSAGETPDRIIFLDSEDADAPFTKVLDFGDIPRGVVTLRQIKLKNNSSTKTINTIQITAEDLYLNAGNWYTFGDDGITYVADFAVGNLGPGSTQLIYIERDIPVGESMGLQTGRIKVSHASVT